MQSNKYRRYIMELIVWRLTTSEAPSFRSIDTSFSLKNRNFPLRHQAEKGETKTIMCTFLLQSEDL